MRKWPEEFNSFTEEEKNQFKSYFQFIEIPVDTCLFKAGDKGDYAVIIDEGKLRLEFERAELDSENVLCTIDSGTLFGELVLFDKGMRSLAAYAETDASLYIITDKALDKLVKENAPLAIKVYAAFGSSAAKKLRESNKRMSDLLVMSYGSMSDVDQMIETSAKAQKQLVGIDEERIDKVLFEISEAITEKSEYLSMEAVKQTHLGNVKDKTAKTRYFCVSLYYKLVGKKGYGVVSRKRMNGVMDVADAMGVIFGLIPVTNPVSTACFKSMISLKSRNAIILSPNRIGSAVVIETVDIIRQILGKNDFPVDVIQVIRERSNRALSNTYMRHKGIALILATGGSEMVRAAYGSGNPAIGVGPGNAPCLIASDADIAHAAKSIIRSKSFDNGLICGSEHNLIVVKSQKESLLKALEQEGAAILTEEETGNFTNTVISTKTGHLGRMAVGQDANKIAAKTGIERDYSIRLIIVPSEKISSENPWTKEKMGPVLSIFTVDDDIAGIEASEKILNIEGSGHTAAIHTASRKLVNEFGRRMPASRILVNSPAMQGISGLCTGLEPSLTLGCGSFGGNSTTDNVNYRHLMNIKRVAWFLPHKKLEKHLAAMANSTLNILLGIRFLGYFRRTLFR